MPLSDRLRLRDKSATGTIPPREAGRGDRAEGLAGGADAADPARLRQPSAGSAALPETGRDGGQSDRSTPAARWSLRRIRFDSLYVRLILGAALWSLVALAAAGVILISLYRTTVESAFDDRLNVYLKTLIGAFADQAPAPLSDPGNLGEQRFEQLFSGWYWQARKGDQVVLASGSLFTDTIDFPKLPPEERTDGVARGIVSRPDGQTLRVLEQIVKFPGEGPGNAEQEYEILVAGDLRAVQKEIAEFRNIVALTLAVLAVGLIIATAFQVRWGLRPLGRVSRGLADLRSGKEARFEGPFPVEVEPLARELNALLQSNREIIERARTQVGNLAHALKTPLSVITNESRATEGPLADKVTEQAAIMRSQIAHYLDRARIAANVGVVGSITPVEQPLSRLVATMEKIHGGRGIVLETHLAPAAAFRGERQDLEEIAGNLLDNASKWARSIVVLGADYEPPGEAGRGRLTVTVDDDGPGLTPEECQAATRRGKRLDETKPGSGLGLSIVAELVSLYGGAFTLSRSPRGGLRATVDLPAA
jgi:signal transduction histidine kinase